MNHACSCRIIGSGKKCQEEDVLWRRLRVESWLQRRWTEHRGVPEGQQTCRLICTWTLFPNYFFSAPSHSRVFRRKGRWPKRRKEGEPHIYLDEGFLNSRRAAGRSSKGDAVNVHGDGMYHSEKRGTKYYSVW